MFWGVGYELRHSFRLKKEKSGSWDDLILRVRVWHYKTYFHENYYWHEYYDTGGHGNAIHYVLYTISVEYKITILQSCKNNINI